MRRVTLVLKTNEGGLWVVPQLVALRSSGATVTAVIPPGDGRLRRALEDEGLPVVDSPFDFSFGAGTRTLLGLLRLRRVIRATRPDVVFYHLYASALAARAATWGTGVRRVHMVAGPLYLDSAPIRALERVLVRLDSHVVAGSRHTARRYRALGLPARRLSAVPYGVDIERFTPTAGDRAALGLEADAFVVVMVAHVYAPRSAVHPGLGIKGHDVLLRAWPSVRAAEPRARLLIVGSGFDAEGERHRELLRRRFDVDADPSVTWLDRVEDVRPYYASADVSVSPSLSENHGAALEASAMGVPSVVSDAGALPETVTAGSGWVVPAGDADGLARALRAAAVEWREGRLRSRGAAAREHMVSHFDLGTCVAQVRDIVTPAGPARVAAFCEQRAWRRGESVLGRKDLVVVDALSDRAEVELVVRVGPDEGAGSRLAPAARTRALVSGSTTPSGAAVSLARNVGRTLAAVRRADVVYADQPGITGAVGLGLGRLLGRPLVVNVVGDAAESVQPEVVPGLRGRVALALLPAAQRWAVSRAAVTNFVTREALQRRYPPGPGTRSFSLSTAQALGPSRPRSHPRGQRLSLVTVSSLEQPYKGVAELLEAVGRLGRDGHDVRVTVVGEGRLRAHLESVGGAVAPGLVRFTGQLYGQQLWEEMGRHDAFVLASWTEGLPRALVEAMADGMPCVATDVGGVPELLEPSRLVPRRDPEALAAGLERLLSDEPAWHRSVEHNLAVAARYLSRDGDVRDLVEAALAVAGRDGRVAGVRLAGAR